MTDRPLHVVTGAFGFSGRYIAGRLLHRGLRVRTLTNKKGVADPFEGRVEAHPLAFGDRVRLARSLEGAEVLYNTYWVRFNHPKFSYSQAVDNTLRLFDAAKQARIQRIVHISISNPSEDSDLEYFRGKAVLERALKDSGLSYAILRPAVLFGEEGILINNIAWALRRLPVMGVFGDGAYRLRPIHVDDLAKIAVEQGALRDDVTINAVGPETFTYRELTTAIGEIIGKRRPVVSVSPALGYAIGWAMGKLVGDVFITRDEIKGLMADLLYVDGPSAGETRLTDWARQRASTLGRKYASELARR